MPKKAPATLDIDLERYWMVVPYNMSQQEVLDKIIYKVKLCGDLKAMSIKQSFSGNGYHITLYCPDCGRCRLVFDDPARLQWDFKFRPPHMRNVLFDRKERVDIRKWCNS